MLSYLFTTLARSHARTVITLRSLSLHSKYNEALPGKGPESLYKESRGIDGGRVGVLMCMKGRKSGVVVGTVSSVDGG